MKVIITIILIIPSFIIFAKERQVAKSDSLLSKLDTLKLLVLNLKQADTVKLKIKNKLDSLALLKAKATSKIDSINPIHILKRPQQKLDSIKFSLLSKTNGLDSLQAKEKLAHYHQKLDSVRTQLQSRIDSLSHLKLDLSMIKGMDSLKLRLDSLKNNGPLKDIRQAEAKFTELQQKVGSKVAGAEKRINEKLGVLTQQGLKAPAINLPGTDLGKLNLPDLNTSLPNSLSLGNGLKLPDAHLPTADLSLNTNADLNLKGLGEKANIGDLPDLKTNPIQEMEGLKSLQKDFAKVGEIGTEIQGYQNDIQKVREGGLDELEQLPEKAEEKALELVGDEFKQRAAMVEKWKSNPAYAKELVLNQAKEQAVNHFAGKEEQLKAAMEQLGKLKSKYQDAEGVLDLFQKKQHPLKGKPFVERIIPGINIQVQASTHIWIDFNPYVGYQISRRFTAGAGWNERLSVDFKEWNLISNERIYGPRSFLEFKFKENLILKVETEWMNAWVHTPMQKALNEVPKQMWVWSSFAGMKNVFNLSKKLKGNAQVLYNLYDLEKRSPYASRLNVRFGFEYVIKKNPR
jgi:hypothetical protein